MCWSKWVSMFELFLWTGYYASPNLPYIRLISCHSPGCWWVLPCPYLELPDVWLFKWDAEWGCWIRIWHPSPLGVINRTWAQNVLVGLIKNSLWNCTLQRHDRAKNTLPQTASRGYRLEQRRVAVPFSSPSLGEQSLPPSPPPPCPKAYENKLLSSAWEVLKFEFSASFPGSLQEKWCSF